MAEIISFIKSLDKETKEKMINERNSDIINKYYETHDLEDKKAADRQVGWELISLSLKIRLKLPEDMQRAAQMGFCIIEYKFSNDENVKEYFAIKMLDIIMDNEKAHLEDKLHNEYANKEEVLKKGINTIILEIVSKRDYYLKEYLLSNLDLLSVYYNDFEQILNKWDEYNFDQSKKMVDYDELNILIDQFIKKYSNFLLKRDVVVAYIEKTFDLSFEEYYGYNKAEIYKDLNLEPINYEEKLNELTFKEQHQLLELKGIVSEFLKLKNHNQFYDDLLIKAKVKKNKK